MRNCLSRRNLISLCYYVHNLKGDIVKRFVLNDDMLKNGRLFGKDYFDELLEKIREIRASERRAYQKIADVFEQCSSDY